MLLNVNKIKKNKNNPSSPHRSHDNRFKDDVIKTSLNLTIIWTNHPFPFFYEYGKS